MKYIIFLFRAIWLALSLLILFFSMHRLSLLDSTRDVSELISLMSYGMMVICFPTGIVFFIALIFIGTVSDIIGVRIDSKYIMAIIIWLYFLSGGYIQWFVLSKRIIKLNLQSKCNKKRSTHQLEYNFVSTQKPFPNDEYFLPTSYNKRARKDNDFTRTGQKTSRNCQSTGT